MATGLLIRDFNKDERELRYKNSGSIAFSEIEHNAYRLSLTLEITHIDAPRYSNLKTLPENTHFGYVTLFRGSTVTDSIAIKYPKFRVFDIRNDGIWQYHQHTESIKIIDRLISEYGVSYHAAHLAITESTGGVIPFPKKRGLISLPSSNDDDYDAFTIGIEDISDAEPLGDNGYRAFPIASPFPDIVKFKGDIPCSFLFRLEMWYLVNPAVYIVDNPTDTGDKTDDEDEYPSPDEGDGDGDGSEFPPSSEAGPGRDPRDFGDQGGGDPSAPGVTNIFGDYVAYPDPVSSTNTVSFRGFIMQVPGRATAGDVSYSCVATTPSSHAAAGKCFRFNVTCFGVTVEQNVTIESLDFVAIYSP